MALVLCFKRCIYFCITTNTATYCIEINSTVSPYITGQRHVFFTHTKGFSMKHTTPYLSLAAAALLFSGCTTSKKEVLSFQADATSTVGQEVYSSAGGTHRDFESLEGNRVFFAFDSSSIGEKSCQTLKKQVEWLLQHPQHTVTIEGHCDERGTADYNLGLGERRANAAKQRLIEFGMAPDRIKVISYGKEKPFSQGHHEKAWAQNRVAITVVDE